MTTAEEGWRLTHLGRLLGHALRRFDERVLHLMAHNIDVPLALSNLAARAQIGAAHVHITRHLDLEGTRLTDLAQKAGMSKQAMGDLVGGTLPVLYTAVAGMLNLLAIIDAAHRAAQLEAASRPEAR